MCALIVALIDGLICDLIVVLIVELVCEFMHVLTSNLIEVVIADCFFGI